MAESRDEPNWRNAFYTLLASGLLSYQRQVMEEYSSYSDTEACLMNQPEVNVLGKLFFPLV
jgi:hypothetical protein